LTKMRTWFNRAARPRGIGVRPDLHEVSLMHVKVLLTLIVAAGLSFSDSSAYGTEPVAAPAARVQDFTLRDYRGKEHALSDFADAKVVVLAVLGTECPLAKLYASRLQEIFERYSDRDVVFVGLNANS